MRSSGGKFYQLVGSGWSSSSTFSGGFFSFRGVSSSGELGPSTVEASDIRFSDDVIAVGHLVRPARSASKMRVGVAGALLWVPFKICVSSSGGWSAATRLSGRRRRVGVSLQGFGCNFHVSQRYLCKCWNVNHKNYV